MRGIPEDKAVEIGEQIDSCKYLECSVKEWLRDECQELQEPWMTLEEFLKSGYRGLCWITLKDYPQTYAVFDGKEFNKEENLINDKIITHVMLIHKPEPPK